MTVEVRCASARSRAFARQLAAEAERLQHAAGLERCELSLMLVGDRRIRSLNRDWRGKDEATDVLSFSQLEDAERTPHHPLAIARHDGAPLGDVVISVDTALRQARELGIRPAERLRTLLIHGYLHLIGYDHERSPAEARRMFARERVLARRMRQAASQARTSPR
ncbi:MAG TPA: rRNA maturation RNase YbeY [Candidatus Binataceae bacterium]